MTRTAIISDIHSNWQALKAVWQRIEALNCENTYCLGDIVGYGARPVECLELIQKKKIVCIQGNHDSLVSDGNQELKFNEYALSAVSHNRALLTEEQLNFLRDLPPFKEIVPRVFLGHGAPNDRDKYINYLQDFRQVSAGLFKDGGPGLCFLGHTHIQVAFDGNNFLDRAQTPFAINSNDMMVFNAGSVGQPRDKDPRAAFLVWDHSEETVSFERVSYDVERAREEILASGLPERLANRLREGI